MTPERHQRLLRDLDRVRMEVNIDMARLLETGHMWPTLCKVDDCDRPSVARRLCTRHYQAFRRDVYRQRCAEADGRGRERVREITKQRARDGLA